MPLPTQASVTRATLRVMEWHSVPGSRVAEALGTGAGGLSSAEAARRLEEFGSNALTAQQPIPRWKRFLRQFRSPLIYILFAASLVTFLLGETVDSVVILLIVVFNASLGYVQEQRADAALSALRSLTSPHATVRRDGRLLEVESREVVPGDMLVLKAGDRVAADARLLHAVELESDESSLTGESVPVAKTADRLPDGYLPLGDRTNMAFMNTVVTRGHGRAVVVGTGMATEMGRIAGRLDEGGVEYPLQRRLRRLSHVIGVGVLAFAAALVPIGLLRGTPFDELLTFVLGMSVSAIPESLPIVLTIILAVGVWRMARRKALIRHLPAVETLGSVSTICSDKTGTLTHNKMTVRRVVLPGRGYEVTGEGYEPVGSLLTESGEVADLERDLGLRLLLESAVHCNDAMLRDRDGVVDVLGDPTEGALLTLAAKAGVEADAERLAEVSFTSERRWMATLNRAPDGRTVGYVKGSLERLLAMSPRVMAADGSERPLDAATREAIEADVRAMAGQALRVLAFGYVPEVCGPEDFPRCSFEGQATFLGVVGMIDPPRQEAKEAIRDCHEAGIRVVMVTGDHEATARAIATELGILPPDAEGGVATGSELQALSDEALDEQASDIAVYARIEPEHKLRIVRALKRAGETVAMTGDGVNDAPALAQADIGIAMGVAGTEVAKEASAMVLADDNFATIRAAIEEGRLVAENFRKVVRYLFATSVGELITLSLAVILGMPLPLLALQILWLNLVTDGCFDKSIALEPPESNLMRTPPRKASEPMFGRKVLLPVLFVAPIMALGTLVIFQQELSSGSSLPKAQTMAFSALVFFQWFSALTFRSVDAPVLTLRANRWMFLSVTVAAALHLLVIYAPGFQQVFRTVPLSPLEMLTTFGIASSILWIHEGWKYARLAMKRSPW